MSDSNSDGIPDTVSTASRTQTWTLDEQGNWSTLSTDGNGQNRTYNKQNQLTAVGSTNLAYDNNGAMTTDEAGRSLIYDAWGRLVRVDDFTGTRLYGYKYDALNRRIVETNGVTKDMYFSDQWQLLEERHSGAVKMLYIWSPVYVDALVRRDRDTGGDPDLDEVLYVQQDANWNVTAVTNPAGNVQERYVYDPYGQPTFLHPTTWATLGSSTVAWIYLHQGGRYEATTWLYHFRNRELSPTLGRWNRQDPLGFDAGDTNLYRYLHNNPAALFDPLGLSDGVGHHPVPIKAFKGETSRLCKEAVEVFSGYFTGATDPPHNARRMGGVKHTDYSGQVADLLTKHLDKNGYTTRKRMTGAEALHFAQEVWSGKIGTKDTRSFNGAVKAAVRGGTGTIGVSSWTKRAATGRSYILSHKNRFTGVYVSGTLLGLVAAADAAIMFAVALTSKNFLDGIGHFNRGELLMAERKLIGTPESYAPGTETFTEELVKAYGGTAQAVHKAARFTELFRTALEEAESARQALLRVK